MEYQPYDVFADSGSTCSVERYPGIYCGGILHLIEESGMRALWCQSCQYTHPLPNAMTYQPPSPPFPYQGGNTDMFVLDLAHIRQSLIEQARCKPNKLKKTEQTCSYCHQVVYGSTICQGCGSTTGTDFEGAESTRNIIFTPNNSMIQTSMNKKTAPKPKLLVPKIEAIVQKTALKSVAPDAPVVKRTRIKKLTNESTSPDIKLATTMANTKSMSVSDIKSMAKRGPKEPELSQQPLHKKQKPFVLTEKWPGIKPIVEAKTDDSPVASTKSKTKSIKKKEENKQPKTLSTKPDERPAKIIKWSDEQVAGKIDSFMEKMRSWPTDLRQNIKQKTQTLWNNYVTVLPDTLRSTNPTGQLECIFYLCILQCGIFLMLGEFCELVHDPKRVPTTIENIITSDTNGQFPTFLPLLRRVNDDKKTAFEETLTRVRRRMIQSEDAHLAKMALTVCDQKSAQNLAFCLLFRSMNYLWTRKNEIIPESSVPRIKLFWCTAVEILSNVQDKFYAIETTQKTRPVKEKNVQRLEFLFRPFSHAVASTIQQTIRIIASDSKLRFKTLLSLLKIPKNNIRSIDRKVRQTLNVPCYNTWIDQLVSNNTISPSEAESVEPTKDIVLMSS